jgi:hypothetical protein
VEGSAPSETKEETTHRVGAGGVGALTTLETFTLTDQKSRMTGIHLDLLVRHRGAAWDERP